MKIKVISCEKPNWWYADCVGQEFDVEQCPRTERDWWCESVGSGLSKIDCEVVRDTTVIGTQKVQNQVGNIDSNEKGSGARYNSGKPDYSLLVISDVVSLLNTNYELSPHYDTIGEVIVKLGVFQQTHDVKYLYYALEHLGLEALEESTHVFTYGANKYAQWNWVKGMQWSVPLACALRHSLKILNGEDVDDESNRKHTGHIVCNILMLIHYSKYYKEGNDLPSVEYFK
jgi:hypothetical protein